MGWCPAHAYLCRAEGDGLPGTWCGWSGNRSATREIAPCTCRGEDHRVRSCDTWVSIKRAREAGQRAVREAPKADGGTAVFSAKPEEKIKRDRRAPLPGQTALLGK